MKLVDLEPSFVGNYTDTNGKVSYTQLSSVEGAQGILFICPKCQNHSILCWFNNPRNAPKVPESAFPKPGRWTFNGDTFDILSLVPSVDISRVNQQNPAVNDRCYWHGFVTNGEAK